MINKILHMIYLVGPNTHPFSYVHYLCVKSKFVYNKWDKAIIYTNSPELVNNIYIDKLTKEFGELVIQYVDLINTYQGNRINYLAHQADILRSQLLYEHGGVYSDIDSISVSPIPEWMMNSDKPIYCTEKYNDEVIGLCNGFYLSPKGCEFHNKCLAQYSDYDFDLDKTKWKYSWAEFSVKRPLSLYKTDPSSIKAIDSYYFQPYYLDYQGVRDLYFFNRTKHLELNSIEVHLWENRCWDIMKLINEEYVTSCNTTLAHICKKIINY